MLPAQETEFDVGHLGHFELLVIDALDREGELTADGMHEILRASYETSK